jgi:hypothetical protein
MELNRMLQLAGLVSESHDKVAELPASVTMLPEKTTLTETDKSSEYSRWLQLAGLVSENELDEYAVDNWLLLEGPNEEYAIANLATQIKAAYLEDGGAEDKSVKEIVKYITDTTNVGPNVTATVNNPYFKWIISRFIGTKKAPRDLHIGDLTTLQTNLKKFDDKAIRAALKKGGVNTDLNNHTYATFQKDIVPKLDDANKTKLDNEQKAKVYAAGQKHVIYQNVMGKDGKPVKDEYGHVIHNMTAIEAEHTAESGITNIVGSPSTNDTFHAFTVNNKFASMYFGGVLLNDYYPKAAVGWCTGLLGHSEKAPHVERTQFDTYHGEGKGKIYIIFTKLKGMKRRFQLHMEKDQFMQEDNTAIPKEDIAELSKIPEYTEFLNFLIKKYYHVPESK